MAINAEAARKPMLEPITAHGERGRLCFAKAVGQEGPRGHGDGRAPHGP